MTGLVYRTAPQNIFHSWVEVYFEDTWYELEAFILDREHHQQMSAYKVFLYRNIGRHLMNRNVRKIRKS